MDSKKKISISLRNQEQKPHPWIAKEEQAAASERENIWNHEKSETEISPKLYSLPIKKKEKRAPAVKRAGITVATALVISVVLGFILLRMFVTLTEQTESVTKNTLAPASTQVITGGDAFTLQSYVIQAGVFSTIDKAEEWQMKLSADSISSVIWERDQMFYLFIGSAETEEEAQAYVDQLLASGIDTYIKAWTVKGDTKSLNESEAKVYQELEPYLENLSLENLTGEKKEALLALDQDKEHSVLLKQLNELQSSDPMNVNWLKVALALEEVSK